MSSVSPISQRNLTTAVVLCLPPPPPVCLCSLPLHSLPFYSFVTPPSAPLPPLQSYYNNRANLPPSSAPRGVPPSSGPRPVAPTHVYQAGSQMMMIPGQQLPFPSSPQGPAYFIPGQVGGGGCRSTESCHHFSMKNPPKLRLTSPNLFP